MNRIEYAETMRLPEMQALLNSGYKYGALPKPVLAADLILNS
jgi:hypothetical protein